MAIDPQVLQMIANPTGGKLTQIGQTYQASKQNAVDNKRAQEGHDIAMKSALVKADEETRANLFGQSKVIKGVTDLYMESIKSDPSLLKDQERYGQFMETLTSGLPENDIKRFHGKSPSQFAEMNRNASKMIEMLGEKDTTKPTYQTGYIKTLGTDEVRQGRSENGVAQVQTPGGFRLIDPNKEIFIAGSSTAGNEQLGVGDKGIKPTKGNEKWEEEIILAGKGSYKTIANNNIILNLNKQIEGGEFTNLGALLGNVSESVLGVSASVFSDNEPADVVAAMSAHTSQQIQQSIYMKGNTSNREHADMGIAQGTNVDNPNKAVQFSAEKNIAIAQKDYELAQSWDEYVSNLGREATNADFSKFRKDFNEKSNKSPMVVIHDRTSGVGGFSWKWEYDAQVDRSVSRALASLAPVPPNANDAEIKKWQEERKNIENQIREKSENQWMMFAAKHR